MGGKTTKRARGLRREAPFPERLLWSKLRNRQLDGWKFRRQHPVGPYFADFACSEAKLIVELDGDTHGEEAQQAHDANRTRLMEAEGWEVLRIWNAHLMENIDGALDRILQTLEHRKRTIEGAGLTPLPPGEEGPAAEGGGRGGLLPPQKQAATSAIHFCTSSFCSSGDLPWRTRMRSFSGTRTVY